MTKKMKKITGYPIAVMLRLMILVIVIAMVVLHPILWMLSWLFRGKGFSLIRFMHQHIKNKTTERKDALYKDAENRQKRS